MAKIYPLFSGSSGNSYFLGRQEQGILIDAGKSAKQLGLALQNCQIDPLAVKGIIITHEHSDHVSGLRVFATKYQIPVFASKGTIKALENANIANGAYKIHEIEQNLQIADMTIKHFNTSHDCAQSIGFNILTDDDKRICFATDLGVITDEVEENMYDCSLAVIESNHDENMLKVGKYPFMLKKRILSDIGHLSNRACAEFLIRLHKNNTKKFLLAHLSGENNTPQVAFETAVCSMTLQGFTKDVDYSLFVAPKQNINGSAIIY